MPPLTSTLETAIKHHRWSFRTASLLHNLGSIYIHSHNTPFTTLQYTITGTTCTGSCNVVSNRSSLFK